MLLLTHPLQLRALHPADHAIQHRQVEGAVRHEQREAEREVAHYLYLPRLDQYPGQPDLAAATDVTVSVTVTVSTKSVLQKWIDHHIHQIIQWIRSQSPVPHQDAQHAGGDDPPQAESLRQLVRRIKSYRRILKKHVPADHVHDADEQC